MFVQKKVFDEFKDLLSFTFLRYSKIDFFVSVHFHVSFEYFHELSFLSGEIFDFVFVGHLVLRILFRYYEASRSKGLALLNLNEEMDLQWQFDKWIFKTFFDVLSFLSLFWGAPSIFIWIQVSSICRSGKYFCGWDDAEIHFRKRPTAFEPEANVDVRAWIMFQIHPWWRARG